MPLLHTFPRTVLTALLIGLSFPAAAQETAPADDPDVSEEQSPAEASSEVKAAPVDTGLTGKIFYQLVLAEIAAARGQMPLAVAAYGDLANSTKDNRVARRYAEFSLYSQIPGAALTGARTWAEIDPSSSQARQNYWSQLAIAGQTDELVTSILSALKSDPEQVGGNILMINRLFSQVPDKNLINTVVDRVAAAYQNLPEAQLAQAEAAFIAKKNDEAMGHVNDVLKIKPDWVPAVLLKAQLLIAQPQQAIALLDDFLSRNKEQNDVSLARARLLVDMKRYEEARDAFVSLSKRQPDNTELIYATALLSLQTGKVADAETGFKKLVDNPHAQGEGQQDSLHAYLGQIAEDGKRYDEALGHYNAVTTGSSQYMLAQRRSVGIYRNQGKADEAQAHLKQAMANASPETRISLLLMQVQMFNEANRPEDAFNLLSDASNAQPTDPTLLYELGLLADQQGKFDVSERSLRKLIQLQPNYAHAYNALGYSLAERGVKLDEAQQLLDKALQLAPDDAFILDSRGWLAYRQGDMAGAENFLRRAATLRSDAEFAAHLGEILWVKGDKSGAQKVWADAAKQDPQNELLNKTVKRLNP